MNEKYCDMQLVVNINPGLTANLQRNFFRVIEKFKEFFSAFEW
jgi:hypothetical protein